MLYWRASQSPVRKMVIKHPAKWMLLPAWRSAAGKHATVDDKQQRRAENKLSILLSLKAQNN